MRKLLRQVLTTALMWTICQLGICALANEAVFREATSLYQQAHWQHAEKLFTECANDTASTNYPEACFYRGECLTQLGNYTAARQQYQIARKHSLPPSLTERVLFRAGEAAWFSDDSLEAKKLLTQYVEQYSQGVSAVYAQTYLGEIAATEKLHLGRSQYDSEQYDSALATFRDIQLLSIDSSAAQQARLAAGWTLWKLEQFSEIQAELQPLAENPHWTVEYRYLTGLASYAQLNWPAAIENLTLAASGSDNHANRDAILFYLGESCLRDGQSETASTWYQQVIDRYPTSRWAEEARHGLVRISKSNLASDESPTVINKLRKQLPTSSLTTTPIESREEIANSENLSPADKLLDKAVGQERDGRFDPALATYSELLDKYKTGFAHQEALKRMAKLHAKLARYSAARDLLKTYLASYPGSESQVTVLADLAWIEERLENHQAATKVFTKLQAEFPQSAQAADAAYWLALHWADENNSEQAHHYVDWLIEHHAGNTEKQTQKLWEQAVCLKCQLAASTSDWQTIQNLLDEVGDQLAQNPTRIRAKFWQAEADFRSGKYKQARIAFEKLRLLVAGVDEPWVAMVPLRRAQLFARRQQWTETLKSLDELNRLHPHFELAYEADYLRGRALAGRAEMSKARKSYHKVLANPKAKETETAAMAQWMIGETFFHQYDYARAREIYLLVIDQHPLSEWQARAALQAGKCWELEGQWEKAKTLYSTALKRWSGSESEKQLQARLKWADSQVTKRR